MLDRAELVGHVEDGHPQLAVQPGEECGEGVLCIGVDTGRRLVEDQQPWLGGDRLGYEGALLLAAGEGVDRLVRLLVKPTREIDASTVRRSSVDSGPNR